MRKVSRKGRRRRQNEKKRLILSRESGYEDDNETDNIDENESNDNSSIVFCCKDLQFGYNPVFVMVSIPQSFYVPQSFCTF